VVSLTEVDREQGGPEQVPDNGAGLSVCFTDFNDVTFVNLRVGRNGPCMVISKAVAIEVSLGDDPCVHVRLVKVALDLPYAVGKVEAWTGEGDGFMKSAP